MAASMLDIKQQIIDTGETLKDLHVARAMVLSLPKTQSWDVIKIQLFDVESAKLTSKAVSTKLQSEANRRAREKAGGNTALYTHHKGKSKGKGGDGKGKWQAKPTDECRYCRHLGHWTRHCPQCEEDKKKASGTQSANLTVSHLHDLGTCEVGRVYVTIKGTPGLCNVLLDSAATSHMFCNRKVFGNYVASHGGETVSVGDKHTLVVEGRGSVTFKIWLSNGFQTIVLHGALHVPWLATNLVSLGALQQEGSLFCSCEDGLVVTQGGDELFRATLNDGLYYINCASDGINEMVLTVLSGSLRLWHRRMGPAPGSNL
jgi:hypothetical protein